MDYRIKPVSDDYYVRLAAEHMRTTPRCPICGDCIEKYDIVDEDSEGNDCHKACLELEKEVEDEQT